MASQGPNSPITGENDAAVGTFSWTAPATIVSSNNAWASVSIGGSGTVTTNYIKATNFGFSIPSGVTIDGIIVEIERKQSPTAEGLCKDVNVKLVKGGTVSGNNNADTSTNWPITDTYKTYGSSSDLWGLGWTHSDINAANFGVVLNAIITIDPKDGTGIYVDHIRITVHYSTASPSASALLLAGD